MAHNILVWIENFNGSAATISHEALGAATSIADGGTITAVVFGANSQELAKQAITLGAANAIICEDATLQDFRPEPAVALLAKIAQESSAGVIMAGASTSGRDVSGALAVALNAASIADVTALELQDGSISATRAVYAGKLLAILVPSGEPVIITTRSRAFPVPDADDSRTGDITNSDAVLSEDDIASKQVEFNTEGGEGEISLADAQIIVSGGRGVGGPEGFAPVAELAKTLGAALGASRAAVDAGWIPYKHQVGQTGKTVAPDLYIACGISGAIQHQAGMRTAKLIVAINTDPEAPIFKLSRYGVVGDLFDICPALSAEFSKRLSK